MVSFQILCISQILKALDAGKTFRQIIDAGDWDFKAYCMIHKDTLDKMVKNWQTVSFGSAEASRRVGSAEGAQDVVMVGEPRDVKRGGASRPPPREAF